MYFEDLATYTYVKGKYDKALRCVGWLDRGKPFEKGEVPKVVMDEIFGLCRTPCSMTRGYHTCPFCGTEDGPMLAVERGQERIHLGNGEIRVQGRDGYVYAAPTLIYHYIVSHGYRPPDVFVEAILDARERRLRQPLAPDVADKGFGAFLRRFAGKLRGRT
jgi:hypothetical protein